MARFPSRVYRDGTEPDPRFTLANERTLLAWVRTALALTAAGVALTSIDVPVPDGVATAGGVILLVMGLVLPSVAWFGWTTTERALRRGGPLPSPAPAPILVAGLVLVGVLLVGGILLG